jgi:GNAT superfamily N-acetyltransferase
MPRFSIAELPIPATPATEGWTDFERAIEVGNHIEALAYGTPDLAYEPDEELPHYHDEFAPQRLLVARVDGLIVGRAVYGWQVDGDADSGWVHVAVLPEFTGRGIGRALADAVEGLLIADGLPKSLAYVAMRDAEGEQIPSPTGFGSVPASDRGTKFLLARGYTLEQVERGSRLPLPLDGVGALLESAIARTGTDYALHHWVGVTPERWHEDLAVLGTRMSTDAPTAGLEEPEDPWTAERVVAADARDAASPRVRVTTAVEHVPSGHLVGFTVLSVPRQVERAVAQYATLVLREHRGHRLGMLLKAANLAHLERERPGHPSVVTWNAEENRYMLDVNESIGFERIGFEGAWKKLLG